MTLDGLVHSEVGLEHINLLLSPSKCLDSHHAPSCLVCHLLLIKRESLNFVNTYLDFVIKPLELEFSRADPTMEGQESQLLMKPYSC